MLILRIIKLGPDFFGPQNAQFDISALSYSTFLKNILTDIISITEF